MAANQFCFILLLAFLFLPFYGVVALEAKAKRYWPAVWLGLTGTLVLAIAAQVFLGSPSPLGPALW